MAYMGIESKKVDTCICLVFQVVVVVKNPPASAGDVRDQVQSLDWEDPLEEGMATHFSSCLENPMDRGAWWAAVHRVPKSQARLKQFTMNAYVYT